MDAIYSKERLDLNKKSRTKTSDFLFSSKNTEIKKPPSDTTTFYSPLSHHPRKNTRSLFDKTDSLRLKLERLSAIPSLINLSSSRESNLSRETGKVKSKNTTPLKMYKSEAESRVSLGSTAKIYSFHDPLYKLNEFLTSLGKKDEKNPSVVISKPESPEKNAEQFGRSSGKLKNPIFSRDSLVTRSLKEDTFQTSKLGIYDYAGISHSRNTTRTPPKRTPSPRKSISSVKSQLFHLKNNLTLLRTYFQDFFLIKESFEKICRNLAKECFERQKQVKQNRSLEARIISDQKTKIMNLEEIIKKIYKDKYSMQNTNLEDNYKILLLNEKLKKQESAVEKIKKDYESALANRDNKEKDRVDEKNMQISKLQKEIDELCKEKNALNKKVEENSTEIKKLNDEISTNNEEHINLMQNSISIIEEKLKLDKKLSHLSAKYHKVKDLYGALKENAEIIEKDKTNLALYCEELKEYNGKLEINAKIGQNQNPVSDKCEKCENNNIKIFELSNIIKDNDKRLQELKEILGKVNEKKEKHKETKDKLKDALENDKRRKDVIKSMEEKLEKAEEDLEIIQNMLEKERISYTNQIKDMKIEYEQDIEAQKTEIKELLSEKLEIEEIYQNFESSFNKEKEFLSQQLKESQEKALHTEKLAGDLHKLVESSEKQQKALENTIIDLKIRAKEKEKLLIDQMKQNLNTQLEDTSKNVEKAYEEFSSLISYIQKCLKHISKLDSFEMFKKKYSEKAKVYEEVVKSLESSSLSPLSHSQSPRIKNKLEKFSNTSKWVSKSRLSFLKSLIKTLSNPIFSMKITELPEEDDEFIIKIEYTSKESHETKEFLEGKISEYENIIHLKNQEIEYLENLIIEINNDNGHTENGFLEEIVYLNQELNKFTVENEEKICLLQEEVEEKAKNIGELYQEISMLKDLYVAEVQISSNLRDEIEKNARILCRFPGQQGNSENIIRQNEILSQNLQAVTECYEKVRCELIGFDEKSQGSIYEREIGSLQSQYKVLTELYEGLQKDFEELRQENNELTKQNNYLEEENRGLNDELRDMQFFNKDKL